MVFCRFGLAVLLASAVALPAAAQQPSVTVDGDNVTITGCLARVTADPSLVPAMLVWSRGDIMLAGAAAAGANVPLAVGTAGLAQRVFYWLDDEDELMEHIGRRVQIRGEVDEFQEGEIEIDRDGDFAEIKLDLDGDDEELRVPIAWLGGGIRDDVEFDIVARKVDVNDVDVLGPCIP